MHGKILIIYCRTVQNKASYWGVFLVNHSIILFLCFRLNQRNVNNDYKNYRGINFENVKKKLYKIQAYIIYFIKNTKWKMSIKYHKTSLWHNLIHKLIMFMRNHTLEEKKKYFLICCFPPDARDNTGLRINLFMTLKLFNIKEKYRENQYQKKLMRCKKYMIYT